MFEGHRVVAVTPAGRRRYMELLVPQILSCALVDRYDIWVNTPDPGDLAFLEGVAKLDPRVRLVRHPDGAAPSIESIGAFHRTACDADSIYVRLDDDVVWLEPGFFETLLRFRIDHPDYFLVMPLILNNAACSFLLQSFGRIETTKPLRPACMDEFGWRDPYLALEGTPPEEQARAGVTHEIARLAAPVVGIEDETGGIEVLHQDHAHGRASAGSHRGERHGVRKRLDGRARVGEPGGEHGDGITFEGGVGECGHGRILPGNRRLSRAFRRCW